MSLAQDSKDLVNTIAATLSNRAELFGLELVEERKRFVSAVVFGVAAAILGMFFLLGLSFLALMLLWDSPYRYAVFGGVTVLYAVLALACIAKLKALFTDSKPFAASVQVLKDDAAKLKGEMLTAPPFSPAASRSDTSAGSREV